MGHGNGGVDFIRWMPAGFLPGLLHRGFIAFCPHPGPLPKGEGEGGREGERRRPLFSLGRERESRDA
ncbi:MAG: hypothetical protein OXU61_05900 [Gammaproteobacteria bacterium]|nr:hypothetical protein [Gammaproteobacteria bacterium]